MRKLAETLEELGLEWDSSAAGTWVTIRCASSNVHIVEAPQGAKYYVWCDAASERVVQAFTDPRDALEDGLRRSNVALAQDVAR